MKPSLRVAVFFLLALTMAVAGYCFLMDIPLNPFDRSMKLYVRFQDVKGLALRSPVFWKGMKVGEVRDMDLSAHNAAIVVKVKLDKKMEIPRDSRLLIEEMDLPGASGLEIVEGNSPDHVQPGDTLQGGRKPSLGKDLIRMLDDFGGRLDSALGGR